MVIQNKLLCLFIYVSLLYRKAHLASCNEQAGTQASSWTPGDNHVVVDINKKENTDHVDYEKKAEAHVFTTHDTYFIAKVVISGKDASGNPVTKDLTVPNNGDARRVIFYTIPDKGPQLEVIYAQDLDTSNAKFQRYVNAGANYGPDAEPPAAPATPASTPAEPAQATTPPAAPAQEAQPVAETAPMAQAEATHAAPVPEQTESADQPSIEMSAPATPAYGSDADATQEASPSLAGALGGSSLVLPTSKMAATPAGQLQVGADGKTYQDFELEDSDEEDSPDSGAETQTAPRKFVVKEVYHGQPHDGITTERESDDDYEVKQSRVSLNQYVHNLGERVSGLEFRMDPVEDKVDLLVRMVNYQHELLEVNKIFKSQGIFDAGLVHGMSPTAFMSPGTPLFRPATHDGSRLLDHTQFPSDLKLYVADANDPKALVELGHNDLTVRTEHSEVMYNFKNEAKCNLVKFESRTAWNHRNGDLHPNWVAFYPLDEKVILDFQDSLVMFVKKPDFSAQLQAHEEITLSRHAEANEAAEADAHVPAEAHVAATPSTDADSTLLA